MAFIVRSLRRRRVNATDFKAFTFCTRSHDEIETPWIRQVVSGHDLLRNPRYSKGFAFSFEERDRLHLRGLLPSSVNPVELQVKHVMMNVHQLTNNLEKYHYLLSVHERNERLFYRTLINHFEELLPIMHNPTVRMACQNSPIMFRHVPKAMFISHRDHGHIHSILDNWPGKDIKLMIITDGSVVGPLLSANEDLDLGVEAVGVPMSKAFMYTVCGGINPENCVPVSIDVGTNNESLLESPFYVGMRQKRIDDDAYLDLLDEFFTAVKEKYGNTVMMQFVDMKHEMAMQLVSVHRSEFPCLHDGSHGRAATMLAGVITALPLTKRQLQDHTILLAGEGSLVSTTAEMFAMAISLKTGETIVDVRKKIWLVDSKGLVVRDRSDHATIEDHKLPFMHVAPSLSDLETSVKFVKPTVLIGCSFTDSAPFMFTEPICRAMAEINERPIIFPLNPSVAECSIQNLMNWTDGRAVTANREGHSETATLADGTQFTARQCHSTFLFPGMALGTLMSRSTSLRFEQFIEAAAAVSEVVTADDLSKGLIYPPLNHTREVAAHVAQAVAKKSYESGTATNLPRPKFLLDYARKFMFTPSYKTYR